MRPASDQEGADAPPTVTPTSEDVPSGLGDHEGDGSDEAVELQPLDRRIRALWWVAGAAQALFVVAIAALVDGLAPFPTRPGIITAAVAAALALIVAVLPVLRYRRWRYALRDRNLWIQHGVLWVTVSVIPYSRLQFVDTRQGPLDRLFGLSQLIVHTAALGTSGRLPGLDSEVAERLRERLADLEPDRQSV